MEIFLKYIVILLITIALQLLFSVFFHFGIKQVFEGYSEESANQTYLLLKYIGFALIAGFFTLLLLWNYIGFIYLAWYHKLAMAFMFFYFWIYCKSCMGMLEHLICLMYHPRIAGPFEYDGIWGEFKYMNKVPRLEHDFAWLHMDLSKRL